MVTLQYFAPYSKTSLVLNNLNSQFAVYGEKVQVTIWRKILECCFLFPKILISFHLKRKWSSWMTMGWVNYQEIFILKWTNSLMHDILNIYFGRRVFWTMLDCKNMHIAFRRIYNSVWINHYWTCSFISVSNNLWVLS